MAIFEGIKTQSFTAGASLASAQYMFVKLSAGNVVLAGDGNDAIGILLNNPASGEAATVALVDAGGKCKVVAGGTISQDGYISADSNGKAQAAGSGDVILGQALESAVANDVITIVLGHRGTALANGGYS